jgi:hypothetical protein
VAHRPLRPPVSLTALGETLVARADRGVGRTVAEVVADACAVTGAGRDEVAAELDRLVADGLVLTGFPVPLDDRPERHVRAALAAVTDPVARQAMVGDLDHVDRLRSDLAAAVGDPAAVHAGLVALSGWIADVTGGSRAADGTRNQGGRVAAYLDGRRDLDVTVGADLLDRLRDPLRVVLGAARWLAAEVGAAVEEDLGHRYAELAARGGPVRVSDLCFAAADTLSGAPGTAVHQVVEDFRLRWAELLSTGVTGAGGEVRLTVAGVEGLAAVLFPAVRPGWQAARCHSPDLMLDTGVEPARWVLGELHVALNTTENRVFHTQCERPELLAAGVVRDMAGGRVVALPPAGSPEVSSRTYPPLAVHAPGYLYWSPGADPGPPSGRSYPATGLVVREEGGRLVVSPERSGGPAGVSLEGTDGWTASLVEVFGEYLSALVADRFGVVDGAGHQARIVLDGLVVRRESWRVAAAELPAEPGQLDALRGVLVGMGLPRRVFARTPAERKPFYVDLEAPALLANLARAARVARAAPGAAVDLSEMLPGPDGLWLRDAGGRRYTSEFRVVAVDPGRAEPIDGSGR